ncbi:class C beta-lactamase [Glaciimonas sp. PAMC28666]|uniref:class C beta-lactamase n=1 Tax=Glaciimonas sp. PAMC28666 TaxID=2807626 RepID=UPI00351BEFF2
MGQHIISRMKILSLLSLFFITSGATADNVDQSSIKAAVDQAIQPLIKQYTIPGMAIAVTVDGKSYFYNYGVASKETQQRITNKTLFEIGSFSKTLTATLVSYAQVNGNLSLSDSASKYFPSLRGSSFDDISLLDLGTHTAGGLPLQVPDNITDTDQLMNYFKQWKPVHAAGTYRKYSNLSIGMLGMIAAKSMNMSFEDALQKTLFPQLGMRHSYITVPRDQMQDYAQGYTAKDVPVRVTPAVLASEAYGVKSDTTDLIRFINANMQMVQLDGKLQRAITDTHTGYFKTGEFTQDLIWEQYTYPVGLKRLLAGNAATFVYDGSQATRLNPPLQPQKEVLINKTGSTNGFSAYAAFVPAKKIGIVILANKAYPVEQRVTAAYQILEQLSIPAGSKK